MAKWNFRYGHGHSGHTGYYVHGSVGHSEEILRISKDCSSLQKGETASFKLGRSSSMSDSNWFVQLISPLVRHEKLPQNEPSYAWSCPLVSKLWGGLLPCQLICTVDLTIAQWEFGRPVLKNWKLKLEVRWVLQNWGKTEAFGCFLRKWKSVKNWLRYKQFSVFPDSKIFAGMLKKMAGQL